jgi:hypothetical protein
LRERPENLVVKALKVISAEKREFQPSIFTPAQKDPFGAGLGGGSSDAAFMLKLLNRHLLARLHLAELEERAARIGADSPFFIRNRPALAKGIGNLLEEVELDFERLLLRAGKTQHYRLNERRHTPWFRLRSPSAAGGGSQKAGLRVERTYEKTISSPRFQKISRNLQDKRRIVRNGALMPPCPVPDLRFMLFLRRRRRSDSTTVGYGKTKNYET